MPRPSAIPAEVSVQQGLSAAGGALGFYQLGLAADKRFVKRMRSPSLMPAIFSVFRWAGVLVFSVAAFGFANLFLAEWHHGHSDGDGMAWPAVVVAGAMFLTCLVAFGALVLPEIKRLRERFKV